MNTTAALHSCGAQVNHYYSIKRRSVTGICSTLNRFYEESINLQLSPFIYCLMAVAFYSPFPSMRKAADQCAGYPWNPPAAALPLTMAITALFLTLYNQETGGTALWSDPATVEVVGRVCNYYLSSTCSSCGCTFWQKHSVSRGKIGS